MNVSQADGDWIPKPLVAIAVFFAALMGGTFPAISPTNRCDAAPTVRQVSVRVMSPDNQPLAIDDIQSIFVVMDDGTPWIMGPDPVVNGRSGGGWVDVDESLFGPGAFKPGALVHVKIVSDGVALMARGKLPHKGWKNLELAADGTPNEIGADLSAGPQDVAAGEVAGVVVDPQANPVKGAVVSFPRPAAFGRRPEVAAVTTADDGIFRFPKSENRGSLYMQIEKAGFAPRWIVDVPEGKGFTVHLDNRTRLAGKLKLPDGTAAVNAKIELTDKKPSAQNGKSGMDEEIPYKTAADAQGAYDIPLEPGEYDISVTSATGSVARYQHVAVISGKTSAIPAELGEGVKLAVVIINSITRKPVAGVRLYQEERSPGFISTKSASERVTDANGAAEWNGLLPGPMQIGVVADGFGRWWVVDPSAPGRGNDPRGIDSLNFNLAVGMPVMTVEMEPAVHVTGQVLSPKGEPLEGAVVDVGRLRTGDSRYSRRTDKQGRFSLSFPDLRSRPGQPVAAAKGPGYAIVAYDPKGRFANGISEDFDPKAGDEKSIDVHMTAGSRMHGTVVDGGGRPIAKVEVLAINRDLADVSYYFPRTLTDDHGQFDLGPMRAGEYEVHANTNFGGGVMIRTIGDKTSIEMNDEPRFVSVKEGDNLALDPIEYDGPPPGPVPDWYAQRFPANPK